MNLEAFYHRHKQNWAFIYKGKDVRVRMRTMRGDVEQVDINWGDKYDWYQTVRHRAMHKLISDGRYDYWETEVDASSGRLSYRFVVHGGAERVYYGERWCAAEEPPDSFGNFEYPYISVTDGIHPPEWVRDAIFYQIFPDRFARGRLEEPAGTWEKWGGVPTKQNTFGGDLQGVLDHLDYLTELGITAIYLTPVFQAPSSHKYDTQDYYAVDPQFGSTELLQQLVGACHARGIRVMLDIVFNHTGRLFPPFQDVLEKEADSPYADWFHILQWSDREAGMPMAYETFGYERDLPKLNMANRELANYLLEVAEYWLKTTDIDGFRLDVANEVDHHFWRRFRERVKAIKPDAYILGEIFHDAMAWLGGDQLDAVMDYPVRDIAIKFFSSQHVDARMFADIIGQQLASYPQQVNEAALQLLGSHDTPRLLTLCGGSMEKLKLAVLFQFTYIGAPCIYYGDEIGMSGENDPDNRRCMIWDTEMQNQELFGFYQEMIAMRKAYPALRSGQIRFLYAPPGGYELAYERSLGEERLLIAMNVAPQPGVLRLELQRTAHPDGRGAKSEGSEAYAEIAVSAEPEVWEDLRSDEIYQVTGKELTLELEAYGCRVLRCISGEVGR
ncbi:alpha-glycosidase [Paenibacillus daejeonensis]|uniref:alpha-glycosidase n=1 Tax=Paenibacillus daejeonensis TaxID=135193 RepID=UPI000360E50D|nr:alpha-glycosidase [Paenibacillus daejeonensis]